jgi:hypothetical protein
MNQVKIKYQNLLNNHPEVIVLLAGLYALVINTVLFFLFEEAEIINNTNLIKNNRQITVVQVVIASLVAVFLSSLGFYLFNKYLPNGIASFKTASILILACSCIVSFAFFETVNEAVAIDLLQIVLIGIMLYSIDNNFKTE